MAKQLEFIVKRDPFGNTFSNEILVRCKDCIRKQRIEGTENLIYCPHVRMRVPVDWYCADGEKKDD